MNLWTLPKVLGTTVAEDGKTALEGARFNFRDTKLYYDGGRARAFVCTLWRTSH